MQSQKTAQDGRQLLLLLGAAMVVLLIIFAFLLARFIRNLNQAQIHQTATSASTTAWDQDPSIIIIENSFPLTGAVVKDPDQLLPMLRIWGDGRVVWLSDGNLCGPRQMSEGYLAQSDIVNALQVIDDFGFWEQPASRFTGGSAPDQYLRVSLLDRQYQSYALPEVSTFLQTELTQHATDVHPFAPMQGKLSVGVCTACQPHPRYSSSLGELLIPFIDEGETCITGEVLQAAYEKQSELPCSPQYAMYQGSVYWFSLTDLDACTLP